MLKVLLNAESFGFGPSAAVVEIFHVIKKQFPDVFLGYIGTGHDMDLQRNLDYDQIVFYKEERDCIEQMKSYDVFITAMDRQMASLAKKAGLTVIFYDALAWYWNDFSHMKHIDVYIYQSFLIKPKFPTHLQTPLIEIAPLGLNLGNKLKQDNKQNYALINFGGLQNFYWTPDVLNDYVELVLEAVTPVLASYFSEIKILGNSTIAKRFKEKGVITVSPSQAKALMTQSSITLATPGLGNIYDLANPGVDCLFLPPANDSQGQQLEILKQKGIIDASLDWSNWGSEIDYFKNQPAVMDDIKTQIYRREPKDLQALINRLFNEKKEIKAISKLVDNFGHLRYNTLDVKIKNVLTNILEDRAYGV